MIYIIIGMDKTTGNEWVEHETFEKSLPAAERCQILNTFNNNAVYRVDTVDPRIQGDADVFEPTGPDFTFTDLFGMYAHIPLHDADKPLTCRECGVLVGIPQRHVDFHNKLLP